MKIRVENTLPLLILTTALAPLIWGSTYIVTSQLLPEDRPFIAAAIRCLPAGIVLVLWGRQLPRANQWVKLLALAGLNITLFQALLFIAAYRLPGGLAAVLGACQPLIMLALIWLVEQHRPQHYKVAAAGLAIFGMALLFLGPTSQWDSVGVIAALGGAVSMASGVYLAKRWQQSMPAITFTGWQLLLGGIMLAPAAIFIDPPLVDISWKQSVSYLYLCLFGALIAYTLWFRGIAQLPPVAVSALGLLSPLSAVILGWALLDQTLTAIPLFGLFTVLLSIVLMQCDSQILVRLQQITLSLFSQGRNHD